MKISELEKKVNLLNLIDSNKLRKIKDGEYRVNPCPICGHKDHFTIYEETNSYVSYSSCCNGGSVYKFLQEILGLNEDQAYQRLIELAGESDSVTVTKKKGKPADTKEPDYTEKINDLFNGQSVDDWEYFFSRKIPLSLIEKYKLSIEHDSVGNRAILPTWNVDRVVFYTARALTDEQEPKYKNVAGSAYIFNEDLIRNAKAGDTIFICEGIFDALSLERLGYQAVALGGLQHHEKLTKLIEETKCQANFVTAFDNDEEKNGKRAGEEIRKKLGYKYLQIPEQFKDLNEWLVEIDDEEIIKQTVDRFIAKAQRPDSAADYLVNIFSKDQEVYRKYRERKTGFKQIDKHLDGFQAGLYIIGGTSSVGKTTFTHQLVDQLAQRGEHVLYFSLEQSRFELIGKSLARLTTMQNPEYSLTASEIKGGYLTDVFQIEAKRKALETFMKFGDKISIIEGNFNVTVASIKQYVKEYIHNNNVRPVIVIDYLQIIQSKDTRLSDKQKTDLNVSELKRMSRDLEISVIGISAFNRSNYMTPVDFESFKESGGIEYTADYLWGLQLSILNEDLFNGSGEIKEKREKIKGAKEANPRLVELTSLKSRNGKATFTCKFRYYTTFDLFEEIL